MFEILPLVVVFFISSNSAFFFVHRTNNYSVLVAKKSMWRRVSNRREVCWRLFVVFVSCREWRSAEEEEQEEQEEIQRQTRSREWSQLLRSIGEEIKMGCRWSKEKLLSSKSFLIHRIFSSQLTKSQNPNRINEMCSVIIKLTEALKALKELDQPSSSPVN